jgi:hypothetical protein
MSTNVSHQLPSVQAQAIADLTGYEDAATLRWQQACVQAANTLTALPNGRYVNVRMERMRQGLELAQRGAVSLPEDGQDLSAVVRSGSNLYQIDTRLLTCTCADYQKHLQACKHLLATEVHLGALGLVAPAPPEPPATAAEEEPAAAVSAPGGASEPPVAPTTANWPTSEAPASLNIKLKVGNLELMYTMRDVDDLKLQRRATMSLPWLQDILQGCEANLAARQQEAERSRQQAEAERKVQQRTLDEQIAAAVAAALKAQANGTPPPRAPQVEPTNDTDPSWCPIHRCKMEKRTNERGSWYSHRLQSGAYCKGE